MKSATLKRLGRFRPGGLVNRRIPRAFIEGLIVSLAIGGIFMVGLLVGREYERARSQQIISPLPRCPQPTPSAAELRKAYIGQASFYTEDYCQAFNPECTTANGERFDDSTFTAACSSHFELGDRLRVSYGKRWVEVRCNDRGAFEERYGRIIDLSPAAFEALAPLSKGVITVVVEKK